VREIWKIFGVQGKQGVDYTAPICARSTKHVSFAQEVLYGYALVISGIVPTGSTGAQLQMPSGRGVENKPFLSGEGDG